MKTLAIILSGCLLLTACDSVLRIRGTAPTTNSCLLQVADTDTGRVAKTFSVSGPFEERLVFGGLVTPDFIVSVECDGKIVKSFSDPDIHDGQLNLGTIEP